MAYQKAEQQSWPVAWQQDRLATGQAEIESETFAEPAQIDERDGRFDSKLLISQETEESEAILPEVLVSAAGSNSNSRYEKEKKIEQTFEERTSARDMEDELKQDQREAFQKAV